MFMFAVFLTLLHCISFNL